MGLLIFSFALFVPLEVLQFRKQLREQRKSALKLL